MRSAPRRTAAGHRAGGGERGRSSIWVVAVVVALVAALAALDVAIAASRRHLTTRISRLLAARIDAPSRFKVSWSFFHGLEVQDLVILSGPEPDAPPLLKVEKIRVLGDVLQFVTMRTDRVEVVRPEVFLTRTADGRWRGIDRLRPPGTGKGPGIEVPPVLVVGAMIHLADEAPPGAGHHETIPAGTFVVPEAIVAADGAGLPRLTATFAADDSGGDAAGDAAAASLVAERVDGRTLVHVDVRRLRLTDALRARLPEALRRGWDSFRPSGAVDLAADITYDPVRDPSLSWRLAADLLNVETTWSGFPFTAYHLAGRIEVVDGDATIHGVTGSRGGSRFTLSGRVLGLGHPYPGADLDLDVSGVELTAALREALREGERRVWDAFSPEGTMDARAHVTAERGVRGADIHLWLRPRGVSVAYAPFPYPLRNLAGGEVEVWPDHVEVHDVVGGEGAARFEADATIVGPPGAPTLLQASVEFRDLAVDDVTIAAFPDGPRAALLALHPGGVVSGTVKASRVEGAPISLYAAVTLKGGRVRPDAFPYPVTDLTGVIEYRDGVVRVTGMSGRAGVATVSVEGQVADPRKGESRVLVVARGVPLDARLATALPFRARKAYDALAPRGTVDAEATLARPADPEAPLTPTVRVTLRDVAVTYAPFPYAVDRVGGEIVFHPDGVEVPGVEGRHGAARIAMSGDSRRGGDLVLVADDVPLAEDLRAAIGEGPRAAWDSLAPSGYLSARVLMRPAAEGRAMVRSEVTVRDGELRPPRFPYPVRGVSCVLRMDNDRVEVANATGVGPTGAAVAAGGSAEWAKGGAVDLAIWAPEVPIDDALLTVFPEEGRSLIRSLRPEGRVHATLRLARPVGSTAPPDWTLELRPLGIAFLPDVFQYPLADVRGLIRIAGGSVVLDNVTARSGPARLSASGTLRRDGGAVTGAVKVAAEAVPLDGRLHDALPEGPRRFWDQAGLGGTVSVAADIQLPPGGGEWAFDGRFGVADGCLDVGVALAEVKGEVSVAGAWRQGGGSLDAEGTVHVEAARLRRRGRVEDLSGRVAIHDGVVQPEFLSRALDLPLTPEVRSDLGSVGPLLTVDGIQGRLFGGTLTGDLALFLRKAPLYRGTFALEAARVEDLAGAVVSDTSDTTGRMDASLEFVGVGDDPRLLLGSGSILVTGARLWDLPLVVGVLNVLRLKKPDRASFREASVRYTVSDGAIHMDPLALKSDPLSLDGSGTLDFGGNLSLTLYTELGSLFLNEIPGVGDVVKFIKGNILHVDVRGSIAAPEVRPVVLGGIGGQPQPQPGEKTDGEPPAPSPDRP